MSTILDGALYKKMVEGGASCLYQNASTVNDLNVFPIPDGDTGDNMRMTVEGGVQSSAMLESHDLGEVARAVADGMLLSARGNSGVILSQFFGGIAEGLCGVTEADATVLGAAFRSGVRKAYAAVLEPTEGTILTVAREATEYAVKETRAGDNLEAFLKNFLEEMNRSLSRTPELLPVLKEAGVIDSGGAGLLYVMEGMNKVLCGEEIETPIPVSERKEALDFSKMNEDSELVFGYCTEFLLRLQRKKTDIEHFDIKLITDALNEIGNSVVAIRNGSIVKVHVHTMTPGRVFELGQRFGEFLTVKVENMMLQHNEATEGEKEASRFRVEKPKEVTPYAVVSVASGEGIREAFLSLGADYVVSGGQTNNPSTEDFLTAFRSLSAERIIVMPNNGNIILTASKAAELYTGAEVTVLETKTVGEGYAALSMLNFDFDTPEEVMENLRLAISGVVTAEVTHAVRDTTFSGLEIHRGDYIGIVGKEILAAEESRATAAIATLARLDTEENEVCIVICGADATRGDMDYVRSYLKESHPHLEIFEIDGKQEVYDFIFVLE